MRDTNRSRAFTYNSHDDRAFDAGDLDVDKNSEWQSTAATKQQSTAKLVISPKPRRNHR
jgi:hypothetical protein